MVGLSAPPLAARKHGKFNRQTKMGIKFFFSLSSLLVMGFSLCMAWAQFTMGITHGITASHHGIFSYGHCMFHD